jgi:hypothetical protein
MTRQKCEQNEMFNNPRRNESKMSEATETLRREFKQSQAQSQALPDFMRGALDPLVDTGEQHEELERDHLRWAGRQFKATIVGTASYKHTLHRVRICSSTHTHAHECMF